MTALLRLVVALSVVATVLSAVGVTAADAPAVRTVFLDPGRRILALQGWMSEPGRTRYGERR